jgi:hypothetical protein
MSMLFVELQTCHTSLLLVIVSSSTTMIVALFLDHNHKSNFHHPLQSYIYPSITDKTQSSKITRVKAMHVHGMVSCGRLTQYACGTDFIHIQYIRVYPS